MFFLLIPALSALITVPLSWWIPDLRFVLDPVFYIGLALVTVSLLLFLGNLGIAPQLNATTPSPDTAFLQDRTELDCMRAGGRIRLLRDNRASSSVLPRFCVIVVSASRLAKGGDDD